MTDADRDQDNRNGYGRRDADSILGPLTSILSLFTAETNRKLDDLRDALAGRFTAIEGRVDALEASVRAHHQEDHNRKIARDAQVKPLLSAWETIKANKATLALVAVLAASVLGNIADLLTKVHP